MFQFPSFALPCLCVQQGVTRHYPSRVAPFGNPGFGVVCTYPRLIAAYHVLHRLLVPRHPPYALSSLTKHSAFTADGYWFYYPTGHIKHILMCLSYHAILLLQIFSKNNFTKVELTGIEPVTSWLQTRRSPS